MTRTNNMTISPGLKEPQNRKLYMKMVMQSNTSNEDSAEDTHSLSIEDMSNEDVNDDVESC